MCYNPTSRFHILSIHSQNKTDSNLPSQLELGFPLDCGASISVLKIPTYLMITQMFNICNLDHYDRSKMLTIANQPEVPIEQHISVNCFSSIDTKSRFFMIPFAVADFEYNSLGALVYVKQIQNINI